MVQGGKFWSGATAGFLGHVGAEAWGASMRGLGLDEFAKNTGGIVTFGALSGGVGAELTGGNFWQGAVTGGIVAGLNSAMHQGDNNADVDSQEEKIDLVELFDKVMSNKNGTTLTADEIIKKYNLPAKLKKAINSMKILDRNKVYVDWNNEDLINTLSKINVRDGILTLRKGFIPKSSGAKLGTNGYIISSNGLNFQPSYLSSKSYNPVFVDRTGISGYFPKTNTITSKGAGLDF